MKKLVTIAILLCIATISANAQRIFGAEYFIDGKDPGTGKAISITGNFPADSLVITDSISLAGLSSGVHVLYIRCKDSLGFWSHYVPYLFSIEMGINTSIKSAEAFLDNNDPGIGKATKLKGNFPADSLLVTDSISTKGLALGIHTLNMRAFDMSGISSSNTKQLFSVLTDANAPIIYAECFIDTDPGIGKGTIISITKPATALTLSGMINIPSLSMGKHKLFVRVKDSKGIWSIYENKEFNVCTTYGAEAYFDADVDGNAVYFNDESVYADSLYWDFGNGIKRKHSFRYESMFYDTAGDYKVCLTAVNPCGSTTTCKMITIKGIQHISPKSAHNNGFLLVEIRGAGFSKDSKAILHNQNHSQISKEVYFVNSNYIKARFSLNNIPYGFYNVAVYDSSGTIHSELNQGIWFHEPDPLHLFEGDMEYRIISPPLIRPNNYYNAFVSVSNFTNEYAVGVPVAIRTSGHLDAVLVTQVKDSGVIDSSFASKLPWQRFYKYYNDTVNPTDSHNFAWILLPFLAPGETYNLHFLIKTSVWGAFKIEANIMAPLYSDALLDSIDFRSKCDFLPPCMKCVLDLGGFAPGVGCFTGAFELGCVIGKSPKDRSNTDLLGAAGGMILSCIPGGSVTGALASAAKDLGELANNMDDMDNKNKDCRQCFPNPPAGNGGVGQGSMDPNIKYGPIGTTSDNYINSESTIHYAVTFENADTATAPAAEVVVKDKLDTNMLDVSTLAFTAFGFSDKIYYPDIEADSFTMEIDLRPSKNSVLRVRGYFEDSTNTLITHFLTLNPITKDITDILSDGFLNPNNANREGEGFVLFRIKPKPKLPHLTKINNSAEIVFDYNDPILTPNWTNTIDTLPPISTVNNLPTVINDTIFTVKWSGNDDHSGISGYKIYYSEDNGPFYPWFGTKSTDSSVFKGEIGKTYAFYSIATDNVMNIEAAPTSADAQTQIVVSNGPEKLTSSEVWLKQNMPNPFSGKSIIEYYLPNKMEAKLTITDMMGRKEIVLSQGNFEAGVHAFELSSSGYNKGIYFIKLRTNEGILSKKVIIQ